MYGWEQDLTDVMLIEHFSGITPLPLVTIVEWSMYGLCKNIVLMFRA